MIFKYRGIDNNGKKIVANIEANDIEEAKGKLKARGVIYSQLSESRNSLAMLDGLTKRDIPQDDLAMFCKELSTYLKSGMTLLTALKLMIDGHKTAKKFHLFLTSILTMIEEGNSLNNALTSQKIYTIPLFFTRSIKVAENSGTIKEVLIKMGVFFSSQTKLKKELKTAMAYPIFMISISFIMVAVMITFIIPKVTSIFAETNQELPALTTFVLSISDFLRDNYGLLIFLAIFIIASFKLSYRFFSFFTHLIDRFALMLPIFGGLIHNFQIGRFSYITAIMLKSGVSFAEAIKLSVDVVDNKALQRVLATASVKVVEGNKFSTALLLAKNTVIKKNFLQSLAVGEESSEVPAVLDNLSTLYFEENSDKTKMMLSLIEPILMLVVGGIIGVIVAAMLLPIFSLNLGAT